MEHYQPAAAAIIERAFKEARALGHGGVGVEHLLLAFAHDADSSEAAALRVMGLYYPQLRDHVATVFGRKAPHELSLPYNTVTRHILEIAVGKGEASREDLFDALLAFNNGILDGLIRGLRASAASTHSKNFSIIDLLKKQEHGDDLTSAVLSAPDFLPFLRNLEEQALQDNLTPLAMLWASDDVSFLLPPPDVLPSLSKSFARYAYFSENDKESPKQWCYFLFSAELTVVISAHQALNMSGSEEYWCVGSVSGSVAGEVFERLKSRIKQSGEDGAARLKEVEAELATMREACGIGTTQALRETVRAAWQIACFPTFYSEDKSPADSNSVLTEDLVKQPLKPLPESPDLNYNRRNRDFNKNRQSLNDQIPFAQGDFTEAANFALLYARVEAATTNLINRKIDQRALLAGLVTEHAGTAGKLLRVSGVTLKALRELDQKDSIKDLKMGNLASVDYDKEARRILAAARKKARTAGETSVQTVHLLWAIANSGPNPGREALGKLVSDMFAFREEIETHLSCFRHEGYSEELKYNAMLFNTLVADEHISLEAGEAELEYELENELEDEVVKKSVRNDPAVSACALRDLLAMLKAKPTREVVEVFERTIELARLEQDDGESHLDVSVLLSALAVGSPARRLLVDLSTEIEEGDRQEKYAAFEFVLSQSAHFAQALGETRVGNSHLVLVITEYFLTRHPGRASGIISQLQVLAYLDAATVAGDIDSDNLIELTEAAQSYFNHFEPFAKQIIANAAWMARRSGHVFFGPEHVLQAFFATGHPDYKTFLVMVLGDDRAVPAPHHMQELVERYTGNGLEQVTQPVGMSQQLVRLLSDICQTGLRPQHSQVTALALLKAIVSLQKSLVPVILAELGISPAFVEANLNSANAAKEWSRLFVKETPSNWTVDEIENSQTADFSLFSAQTMTLMAAAPQYAAAGEAVAPLHILSAIIEHPHFQFLSPHNENRGPRVGTAPQHAADVRDDLVHDLSRSSKEILLKAHAIMQRHAVGKKRQIEPEHILLAICEVGDDDCESYLARLGMEINRAQLLILGYINRKGRQNL